MVFLVGKESPFFDREEACRGFEKNKENLDDVNGFERLIKDSRFFNVYDKDGYIGSVFVYQSEADDFFIWVDMLSAKTSRMRGRSSTGGGYVPCRLCRHKALKRRYLPEKAGFEWVDRKKKLLRRLQK